MRNTYFVIPEMFINYLVNGSTANLTIYQLNAIKAWEKKHKVIEVNPNADVPYNSRANDVNNHGACMVVGCDCVVNTPEPKRRAVNGGGIADIRNLQ